MNNDKPAPKVVSLNKEINLLKDTHRKTQAKAQLMIVYRSIAIVFAFGVVLMSATWGWTEYEHRRIEKLKDDLDTQKSELSQHKQTIDTVNAYKQRLYKIREVGLEQTPEALIAYRDLRAMETEGETKLTSFDVSGIKFKASYEVKSLETLKDFTQKLESEEIKKKWRNVVVDKVAREVPTIIQLDVSGDLITKRE